MIPKYRMWTRITSKLHRVDGLYFDNKEVQYIDEVGILRFIKFENTILMQSTGLRDKNGKEIFDGDILFGHAGEDFWEVVEFDEADGKWVRKDLCYYSKLDLSENNEFMEIVGNIYENPEFLEVEI